ncbi:MAG: L-serine ammonia-lyase, iron-sulfur-dependent, subunit beta [Gemmatimonadetes bacterium]|nr:L-serine ammonia-lyase, iron-sulfur-dependent, subunit beta [Gemmatimonadota bacterium]
MVSLFDILGPVMIGPSSSHTAGACRLGLMGRGILGGTPAHAAIKLHGSFAATGEGHGTHRALIGGLLGFAPDDLRLRSAYQEAEGAGLQYRFEEIDLGDDAHPNSAVLQLEKADATVEVTGASIGGGSILVTGIDGFHVELGGDYHTLVVLARDEPGTMATIAGLFARRGVNVATIRADRTGRRKDALMTLEVDERIADDVIAELRQYDWLRWARRVPKIAGG